jgi:putative ABC transport system permease protein
MLLDLWKQAYEAMVYNRRRTSITMVGMAWGIATVVLLLAYGSGFGRAIEAIFAQWGTQLIGVFPGRTSEQAGGSKAGVQVRFTQEDIDRLQQTVPGVERVAHLYLDGERLPPHHPGDPGAGRRLWALLFGR